MPLDPAKLPSARIIELLRAYLLGSTDITDIFQESIYGYRRLDTPVAALPALTIYRESEELDGPLMWLKGTLILNIVLPPKLTRALVVEQSFYITNVVFLYLNTQDCINFVGAEMPWVTDIATIMSWDTSLVEGLIETSKKAAYILKGTINYRVNLLNYYNAIQLSTGVYEETSVVITPQEC